MPDQTSNDEAGSLPPLSYEIESDAGTLPADARVYAFRMTEAVNEPYEIVVVFVTAELDYAAESNLLGHDARVSLVRDDTVRSVSGVVAAIDWLGASGDHLMLRATIRPAFALLEQQVHTRMFQDMSALEIVDAILKPELDVYGREYNPGAVTRGKAPREYCTQYRESNFAFVSRLLEEEGISYVFEHDDSTGAEVLKLIDAVAQLGAAANVDDTRVFPVIVHNPGEAEVESVQAIEWRSRMTSTGVLRRDYDWKSPLALLDASVDTPDLRGRTRRVYSHGYRRFTLDDLAERAGDRQSTLAQLGRRGAGRSNAAGFRAGRALTVDGHGLEQLDEEMVLIRVEHEGQDPSALPSLESQVRSAGGYANVFECVPGSIDLRPPPVTPKPYVRGPQTGIVTGPSGEEIHTDEHGRIAVQFYWDEVPPYDSTSSCWIRVAQTWAGPSWGAQFIPRVGMEVVVDFLEGNPDRPLVTGCVYNGANAPPYALPDNKTQSGLKTSSSPGGDGFNELRFEDAAGAEQIFVHAQKDLSAVVLNDESHEVGHDRTKHVKHDETVTVDNDETITVGHDHSETINHDMSLTVANNQSVTTGTDFSEAVGNNRSATITHDTREKVGGNKIVTVGAAMQVSVGGALNASVGGAAGIEVGGAIAMAVGGVAKETVKDTKSVEVGKDLVVKATEAGQLSTGKALSITSGDAMTVTATKDLSVTGKAKALIEGAEEITIQCGSASIVLKKSGDIAITGAKIDIKGSSTVNVKGSKVNNN